MSWLGLISAGLKIITAIVGYARDARLLRAGAAEAVAARLIATQEAVLRAQAARRGVRHDADSVRADPDRRD